MVVFSIKTYLAKASNKMTKKFRGKDAYQWLGDAHLAGKWHESGRDWHEFVRHTSSMIIPQKV